MPNPNFPSSDEMQSRLQAFLRQSMGGAPQHQTEESVEEGQEMKSSREKLLHFHLTPKEVKAHLDRYVIQQEEAKKVLAVAVCDHYHHIRAVLCHESEPGSYVKHNVLLMGPTGVGKTYLVKCLADLIGVPVVRAHATKFSETGYVGGDVEDLVRDLVQQAKGDLELAQCGIIYLDEVDKLASSAQQGSRDVSGRGVQTNLLKLMEETEVTTRGQNDIQGQIQAMFENQAGGKARKKTINTRHILFIVSGAFDKITEVIRRRVAKSRLGFNSAGSTILNDNDLLQQASTRDFTDYGLEPEFIGRLPVRVACTPLRQQDLLDILKNSEGSILRQYVTTFRYHGIQLKVSDDALEAWAELAELEKTGARGLMTVGERTFRPFKFELPGTLLRELIIEREAIEFPNKVLERILQQMPEADLLHPEIRAYADVFRQQQAITLQFTAEAERLLLQESQASGSTLSQLCQFKFKDFEYGLKLIRTNSGQAVFTITEEVVQAPDKELSNWVVASYNRSH